MKHILLVFILISPFTGKAQCQVKITAPEGVVVELDPRWKSRSQSPTFSIMTGTLIDLNLKSMDPKGNVTYRIEFDDEGTIKTGVVTNPVANWYEKLDDECDLLVEVPLIIAR